MDGSSFAGKTGNNGLFRTCGRFNGGLPGPPLNESTPTRLVGCGWTALDRTGRRNFLDFLVLKCFSFSDRRGTITDASTGGYALPDRMRTMFCGSRRVPANAKPSPQGFV